MNQPITLHRPQLHSVLIVLALALMAIALSITPVVSAQVDRSASIGSIDQTARDRARPTPAVKPAVRTVGAAGPIGMESRFGSVLSKLEAEAQAAGTVRIIIGLKANFKPEGALPLAARQSQRGAIASLQQQVLSKLSGTKFKLKANYQYAPAMALEVDASALKALAALPEVISIEEDFLAQPILASSRVVVSADVANSAGYKGQGYTVAILDTGVQKTHTFFSSGGVISEACYSTDTTIGYSACPGGVTSSTASGSGIDCTSVAGSYSNAADTCGHGTHVAGIVAGDGDATGNIGMAPNANLIAIQVFSIITDTTTCGTSLGCLLSYSSDQMLAMERVYSLYNSGMITITALNMSLGSGKYSSACDSIATSYKSDIDNLRSVGIATTIASGNNGYTNSIAFPACISTAFSVGATSDSDKVADFSNVSSYLDFLAPGVSIDSAWPGGGTANEDGTSMAAPHVAGAWALLRQAEPDASVNEIAYALTSTAKLITDSSRYNASSYGDTGGGTTNLPRISIYNAIVALCTANTITVTTASASGSGSLYNAVAHSCGNTIKFNGDYNIYLTSTLNLNKSMTIDGSGHTIKISGDSSNNGSRDVQVFNIGSSAKVTLNALTIVSGTNSGNGSGVYNGGTLTVTDSTLFDHYSVNSGAGIYNAGTLKIWDSTIGNSNADRGGGIFNAGTLTLTNVTLSGNTGSTNAAGIYNNSGSKMYVRNTIIANSTGLDCENAGTFGNNSNNLIEDGTCSPAKSGDPRLSSIGSYGGKTQTFGLLPGSIAIDAGSATYCDSADQRGSARHNTCDIGAYESQGFTLTLKSGNNQSANVSQAFGTALAVTVTASISEPVGSGGLVTFTAPSSGASLSSVNQSASTASSGVASLSATANVTQGSYVVTATALGASNLITYSLSNTSNCSTEYTGDNTTDFYSSDYSAVQNAVNVVSAGATIKIAGTCAGVQVTSGTTQTVYISKALTLRGGYIASNWNVSYPTTQTTIISAGNSGRVIFSTQNLTLTDLTIQNGSYAGSGGGANIAGTLILSNVSVLSNTSSTGQGGGIYVSGAATITNSQFYTNSSATNGGGFYGNNTVNIYGGTFQNNQCTAACSGGAAGTNLTLTIFDTTFYSNTGNNNGGALHNNNNMIINGAYFQNNHTTNSEGGAIANFGAGTNSIVISASQFYSNSANSNGGAIRSTAMVSITNSSFDRSSANTNGGAFLFVNGGGLTNTLVTRSRAGALGQTLYNSGGTTRVVFTTIASPTIASGAAIFVNSGTVNVTDTIVASHTVALERGGGTLTENYNLFDSVTKAYSGSLTSGSNSITGTANFINPIGSNYHIGSNSAALNAGIDVGVSIDYENDARPMGGGFDLGYDETTYTVTLAASNNSPTYFNTPTTLTATLTHGSNFTFTWNFGDGNVSGGSASPTTTHAYSAGGAYTARVTATNSISTVVATTSITINEPITGLSINTKSPTTLGQSTAFTASIATGNNVSYAWNFGDGSIGSSNPTTHIYSSAGTYTARVTATNSISTVFTTAPVTITNLAPIADAGSNQSANVNSIVTLNGSASTDPDGHTPLTVKWAQTGGTSIVLSNNALSVTTFTAPSSPSILTFTLTVTDSYGLAGTPSTTVVTITDLPITNLNATNSSPTTLGQVTAFTATITTGSNVSYAWNFGDGSIGSGDTTTHTYSSTGTFTARVTATNSISTVVATTPVTITNLAPIADAGSDHNAAVNSIVTLDGRASNDPDGQTPLTYQWTQTGGTSVVLSDSTLSVTTFTAPSSPSILTFTLTVTDAYGLVGTPDSIVITIDEIGISGLSAINDSPTPLGGSTAFTVTISTGSNVSYDWNFGDGSTDSGDTAMHTYSSIGTYTARVTATNSISSVVATTAVTITDTSITNLSAINDSPTTLGQATNFTATATGSNVTYAWNFGDGSLDSGSTTAHTYSNAGYFTARVTATNSISEVVETTPVTITNLAPIADAGSDHSADVNSIVTLDGSTSYDPDGHTPLTYQWTQTGGTAVVLSDSTLSVTTFTAPSSPSILTFTLIVTDAYGLNGLPDPIVITINEIGIADLSATNDSPTPLNQATAFTATIGTGSNITYAWDFGDGSIGSGDTTNHIYSTIGTYTAHVTATNSISEVVATTPVTITDTSITNLSAANSSPTTLGQATAFTATAIGSNIAYTWNFGDGSIDNGSTMSHTYSSAGNFTACVTATNSISEVVTTTPVTITNLAPIADAGSDQIDTVDSIVTLDGSASTDPDGHLPLTYFWEQIGGAAVTLSSNALSVTTFTAPASPANLTFTLIVTDAYGLASTPDSIAISVTNAVLPITGLSAANSSPTTLGQSTDFTASITSGSNVSYAWNFDDGSIGSGSPIAHTYSSVGYYTARVTATNSISTVVTTTPVTITDIPITNLSANNSSPTALGAATIFTATATGSNITYAWNFGDGSIGGGSNTNHTYAAVGTYTTRVTATNSISSVVTTMPVTITDTSITNLSAINSSPTTLGQATAFTATAIGSNIAYAWNFGDGSIGNSANITHTYSSVGNFTARVTATNSISVVVATTSITITNLAPIADAGSDHSVNVNSIVTLDGSASTDPDEHTPLTVLWTQTGGTAIVLSNNALSVTTFTAPSSPSILTFTLTVTDAYGLVGAPDSIVITISEIGIAGLSAINSSPTTLGQATAFTATIGTGSNVSYEWNFGDGSISSGGMTTHTYSSVGNYTVRVTATNSISTVFTTTPVTITNGSITNLSASNSSPTSLGQATAFTATITAGTNVTYTWNFGDDSALAYGASVLHTYANRGNFTATVTATNSIGAVFTTTPVVITSYQVYLPLTLKNF